MGITNSTELDISDKDLQEISLDETGVNLAKVTKLFARRNRISKLPSDISVLCNLTEISLRDNALTNFPMALCKLKTLTRISLSYNQIRDIPEDIKNLQNLQLLSLAGNQIQTIPASLGNLTNLYALDLQKNKIVTIPNSLYKLKRLETLLLQKNQIFSLPKVLSRLKSLRLLNVSFNSMMELPSTYSELESLQELICSSNRIGNLPAGFFIGPISKSLKNLDFHTNNLSVFPSDIGCCKNLKRLNLAINNLTELPNSIGELRELEWLNVNDNLLTTLPHTVVSLEKLKKVGLVQNELVTLPNEIAGWKTLTKLDVRRNKITAFPPTIRHMKSLTSLLVDDNPLFQFKGEISNHQLKKSRIGSLLELSARAIWKTQWKSQLASRKLLNPIDLCPAFPSDETNNEPNGDTMTANERFKPIIKTFEAMRAAHIKKLKVPEYIQNLELPDRIQRYVVNPCVCNHCVGPFCQEAIEYIDLCSPLSIHDQRIPIRLWLCSRECLNQYLSKENIPAPTPEIQTTVSMRWLSTRPTIPRNRTMVRQGLMWYAYVTGEDQNQDRTDEEGLIPRGWLVDRIREAHAEGERHRVDMAALERRVRVETF